MAYSVMVEFLVSADDPDTALGLLEACFENITENPGIRGWCIPDPGAVPATPEQETYLREIDSDADLPGRPT